MGSSTTPILQQPLLTGPDPEDENPLVSFKRNSAWDKPGPYVTKLSPKEEKQFQQWVKANKIPWQDTPTADYDMRGYWKATLTGGAKRSRSKFDNTMHFPDRWKTPYDATFSNQSMYAQPTAPKWVGDKLIDDKGKLIVDETPRKSVTVKNEEGLGGKSVKSKAKKAKSYKVAR